MRELDRSPAMPRFLATTLLALAIAPAAMPCTIIVDPNDLLRNDYIAFYGEVTRHVSIDVDACGPDSRADFGVDCSKAWGIAVKILEPVHVPEGMRQVEFYESGFDPLCSSIEQSRARVEEGYPAGARVKIIARRSEEPPNGDFSRVILEPNGFSNSITVIPPGQSVRRLAAAEFDYAAHHRRYRGQMWGPPGPISTERRDPIAFELYRDKLRLMQTRTESEVFRHLLRMGAAGDLGDLAEDGKESRIEILAAQYLPAASVREELARALRSARYDSMTLRPEDMLEVARERAQEGDLRGMFEYAQLLDDSTPAGKKEHEKWIRDAASRGFLPAISVWRDLTYRIDEEDPVRIEAVRWYEAAESAARRAARKGDPTAYLFLADFYSNFVDDAVEEEARSTMAARRKAERYSCLLDAHPDGWYWKEFATSGWSFIGCPGSRKEED